MNREWKPLVVRRPFLYNMKYSILGFNQEEVLKCKTTIDVNGKEKEVCIDVTDLLILQCVSDFMNRQCVYKYVIDDKMYFSIQYKALLEDLPILNIGKQALRDRIDKLVLFNILEKEAIRNEQGSFVVFRIGTGYEQLVYNKKWVTVGSEIEGGVYQTTQGCVSNYTAKNSSTINSSTIKEKEDNKLSSQKKFNFKQALLDLGVCENVANDFLLVRKNKKATNSETAFKRIKSEINKSGLSANDCITIAVENSWKGFNTEWLCNAGYRKTTETFREYTPRKTSTRANEYLSTLKVDVVYEKDGVSYLKDGSYIENGKRFYLTSIGRIREIPMGLIARPSEDWEYDNNTMVWVQDERKKTISDMLFE